MTSRSFIMINNIFISEDSEYHFNDKELYLYSFLYMNKRLDGKVITTLSVIHDFMNIKFSNQKDRNIRSIKEVLENLHQKGILKVCNKDYLSIEDFTKLKASDSIELSFAQIESKGHVQIPYSLYHKCQSLQSYYIVVAVKRWENTERKSFNCDLDRFSRILGVARSTAQRNIDKAIDEKLIYRNTGDYVDGELKQGINEYRCTPFTENEKSLMTKRKEYESQFSSDDVLEECDYDNTDLEDAYEWWNTFEEEDHRNGGKKQYIPESDVQLLYIEVLENTKDRSPTRMEHKLIDKAEWRTNVIMNSNIVDLIEEFEYERDEAQKKFIEKYG